jgi:hypothetical protein
MNDLETKYQQVRREIEEKVASAVKLLEEANQLSIDNKMDKPKYNFNFYDLEDVIDNFITVEDMDGGWNSSGCSF